MATELTRKNITQVMRNMHSPEAYEACDAAGNQCLNDNRTFFIFKNTNASTRTVTFVAQKTSVRVEGAGDLSVANITATIPITTGECIIEIPPQTFNDSNGKVQMTFDAVTNLSVAALRLQEV